MIRVVGVSLCAMLLVAATSAAQVVPDPTDLDLDGAPGVAGPPASPRPDASSVLVGAGRLLIDRSHRGDFDVSGFTGFLQSQEWLVAEHPPGGPITAAILSGYDILLIPVRRGSAPLDPYTTFEVAAIQSFVEDGAGLWMTHDNADPTAFNSLSQAFGVTFKYDFIRDPTNNEGQIFWPTIYLLDPHPVTSGVTSYGLYLGDCLTVSPSAVAIARADDDAFSLFCPAGSRPTVLAIWESEGRAVFSSDITPLHPDYYPARLDPEEELLLQNIVNWLLGSSPTATSPTTWGSVKAGYADEDVR